MELVWTRIIQTNISLTGLFDAGRLAVTQAGEVRRLHSQGVGPPLTVINPARNYALTSEFICQPSEHYHVQFHGSAFPTVQIDSIEIRSICPEAMPSTQWKNLYCGRDLLWMWGITASPEGNWFASFGEDEVIAFDGDWGGYQALIHLWQMNGNASPLTLVVDSDYARLSRDVNTWDVRLSTEAQFVLISQEGDIECLAGVDTLTSAETESSPEQIWERYVGDFELWSVGRSHAYIVSGHVLSALDLQTGRLQEIALPSQLSAHCITAIHADATNSLYLATNEVTIYQGTYLD